MRIDVGEPDAFMQLLQARYQRDDLSAVTGITTDSREVQPGDLYLPIIGERVDGHHFAAEAAAAGATLVIASRQLQGVAGGLQVIQVDDTIAELGHLAGAWRQELSLPLAAITGTNGKTTTKNLAAAMLSGSHDLLVTGQSYNSTIGLPLTLLRLARGHDLAVLEVGTSQPGEVSYLAALARPTMALVTNVSAAHIKALKSVAGVAAEKGALYAALPEDGVALVNTGDEQVAAMTTTGRRFTYCLDPDGNANVDFSARYLESGDSGTLYLDTIATEVAMPQRGVFLARNAVAAAALAHLLGTDPGDIRRAIENFQLPPGRGRICRYGDVTVMDDSYNANPASTLGGLRWLSSASTTGRRMAILGDMLELGHGSQRLHKMIGGEAAALGIDKIYCYGSESRATCDAAAGAGADASHFASRDDLIEALSGEMQAGDVLYVKGSRAMAMETIITGLFGEAPC
ncbi:MAG: UDP-N-acetylmuramoyl-tripeptide--D-alanyl-D-alanine ligase [Candidatus Marinimicrobia bacterium]|nr:UDP-N-acetylmuramoyl-tripeptide--D-alanyl-D-alanine ligase [Candidatus Neomarinimicrobiota bacterium]